MSCLGFFHHLLTFTCSWSTTCCKRWAKPTHIMCLAVGFCLNQTTYVITIFWIKINKWKSINGGLRSLQYFPPYLFEIHFRLVLPIVWINKQSTRKKNKTKQFTIKYQSPPPEKKLTKIKTWSQSKCQNFNQKRPTKILINKKGFILSNITCNLVAYLHKLTKFWKCDKMQHTVKHF